MNLSYFVRVQQAGASHLDHSMIPCHTIDKSKKELAEVKANRVSNDAFNLKVVVRVCGRRRRMRSVTQGRRRK